MGAHTWIQLDLKALGILETFNILKKHFHLSFLRPPNGDIYNVESDKHDVMVFILDVLPGAIVFMGCQGILGVVALLCIWPLVKASLPSPLPPLIRLTHTACSPSD